MEIDAQSRPVVRRSPAEVMRLARLGASHASRLSFMRVLLRRLQRDGWRVTRTVWRVDAKGEGVAVYTASGPGDQRYSLVAFGHDMPAHRRSDRVTAEAWDATFALVDGVPSEGDLARLGANVPRQEAGRLTPRELCLARANRSGRLFDHVVERLAAGRQPDADAIERVGYVMRTTAVYGSGKFGAADREFVADRPELAEPFQVEMLAVYLIRAFSLDLVEYLARERAPDAAVPLTPGLRRRLGIGNATGLGMAPFLINHPILINNWITAREEALARVRRLERAEPERVDVFIARLSQVEARARDWHSEHPLQAPRIAALRDDLARLRHHLAAEDVWHEPQPWDRLYRWSETRLSLEGQEQLVSLLMEPFGDLVDGLACCMSADESLARRIDGTMRMGDLRRLLQEGYDWALEVDFASPEAAARLWYVSAEKMEPRLGERGALSDAYEQPLAPGRDARALFAALADWPDDARVAALLLRAPEHRRAVRRAQLAAAFPYAEIRDNTLAAEMRPVDLLRAKLAFFGATRFDPRSDRWVRITMYQGAPLPDELALGDADAWIYDGPDGSTPH